MSLPKLKPENGPHQGNIASRLARVAREAPARAAVRIPEGRASSGQVGYRALTFRQLDEESDRYAQGLARLGIGRGTRVLLMVPPGAEFLAVAFALFKIAAVVILIDPGIGKNNLLQCIREVEPEGLIAVSLVHALRQVHRHSFRYLKYAVTVGRRWFWHGPTLAQIRERHWSEFPTVETTGDDPAAIVFTTGSTGVPKGVLYRHGMLAAQVDFIKEHFGIGEEEVGLAAFAPFALFSIAMGTTCLLPNMDPTRPAQVDSSAVIRSIQDHHVTYSFGSPAFWDRVSHYAAEHRIELPTLKKVMMAGAPVAERILRRLSIVLPHGAETYTPYGATEALPVTSITGREILGETAEFTRVGAGICVGPPLPGIALKIIRITDDVIAEWDEALVLPPAEIGEIVVHGPVVATEYYGREKETARAKIRQGDILWHRMGDVGYLDEKRRLWFCGRKSHRVITARGTLFPVQCEAIFNCHPDVLRSALVGVGPRTRQRPVLIIEPHPGKMPARARARGKFIRELLDLGGKNPLTREITDVLFHPGFPVDFRHNAKILREKLALWAEGRIRGSAGSPWRGKSSQ